jgi:hypothetical protein
MGNWSYNSTVTHFSSRWRWKAILLFVNLNTIFQILDCCSLDVQTCAKPNLCPTRLSVNTAGGVWVQRASQNLATAKIAIIVCSYELFFFKTFFISRMTEQELLFVSCMGYPSTLRKESNVPARLRLAFTWLHGVISQKTEIFRRETFL